MNDSRLRPRTVGGVLDEAITLAFSHWRTLAPIVAAVVIPLQIALAVVLAVTTHHRAQVPGNPFALHFQAVREPDGRLRFVGGHALPSGALAAEYGLQTLGQLFVTAACVRALGDIVAGGAPSAARALSEMVRRLPALIALYVLRWVGIIIGFLLLIVPGVWLAGAWSVAVPALVLEGARPARGLRRSCRLVRHRWWPVFGVLLVADIAFGIVSVAVQSLFAGIDGFSSDPARGLAIIALCVGSIAVALVVQPAIAAVHTVLYLDLRVRRGGDELAALAHQLGLPEPVIAPDAAPPAAEPGSGDQPPYWPPPPGWEPR